ncbi:Aste57867_24669 [Aphanomyces stellatus]|uniref:Aste57867_24669 protein n=1 Tax=Aphanomyces stellatus TaxID=120398 RepID=A0A485LR31_9STRA|nr:hypothetical protein As57867_024591 [Aphanomyces stellatus]VFU01306.1 Aste57867_24669 [Aphanomyces stellatus]
MESESKNLQSHLPMMETPPPSQSPPERHSSVGGAIEKMSAGPDRRTSFTPVASSWNSDQFNASLNTNLLTFSVAPLTHVMQAVGTTIHHHDILLQELAKVLHRVEKEQHELEKRSTTHTVSPEELLSKLEGVEKRVNEVEANVEETNSREEMLTQKLSAVKVLEERAGEQESVIDSVKATFDHINTRLGDFVTTMALELAKTSLRDDMQEMLNQALQKQSEVYESRFEALQQQMTLLASTPNDDDDDNDTDYQELLSPAHVPPAETTMELHRKSKRPPSMRMISDPAQKVLLDQLDQQLKQVDTRVKALESERATTADQILGIHDQVVQCNMDAAHFRQDMISAFDELAAKTHNQVDTSALNITPVPQATPTRKYDDELQRHSDRIERLTKQVGDLSMGHGTDHQQVDVNKAAIKALQDELRKLKAQVDEFQQNQSLMQGFTAPTGDGSASGVPDLSMVFAKLAEMRQMQTTATDDLRAQLDVLQSWAEVHKTQWQVAKHADEGKSQLELRQLDERVLHQKDNLHQQLHLQEHIMTQVTDWLHALPAIRKELEKPESHDHQKIAELQTMMRQYFRNMPSVAALQACSQTLHGHIHDLHQSLLRVQEAIGPGVDMSGREGQLETLTDLIKTLDKHNDGLLKQYDHARVQMDDLWFLWHKKQHMDSDNKYTQLSKEITEVALMKPKVVMPPEPHPLEKKMSLSAQAMSLGEGSDAVKRLEQLLLTACRRLDGFEDDLRALTRNVHAYRGDMTDRVTEGHLSKLKFQIFAELAKIHAVLGSSKFQAPVAATTAAKVYDDSEIKSTLDMQAELIASLCSELKKEKGEIQTLPDHNGGHQQHPHVEDSEKLFNAKLESITEKVAEMFVSLEVQRSSSQPRNIIPAYNPTLLLEAFAQNIEAKLAETQDLTKKARHRTHQNRTRRQRPEPRPASLGCPPRPAAIRRSHDIRGRPVRFDTNVVREVHRTTLGLPDVDEDDDNYEREGDPEFVYRAGFRMPVNEKRNVLPLLVSPRVPPSPKVKGGEKSKYRRFIKGNKKVDHLMREVEDLDSDTLNAEKQVDYKKVAEARKPVAPTR